MRRLVAAALPSLVLAGAVLAQAPSSFVGRLDWVPISGAERNDVGGTGTLKAELSRSDLKITGTFEGLPANATRAALYQGVATGAHGPEIAPLTITPTATKGSISGTVTLTPEQRDALLAGKLYVQLHGERGVPPDNAVLWGWLLAPRPAAR